MVILDTTVVNVAFSSLGLSMHMSTTGLEWVIDAYGLVFATLLLFTGALGDRRGAKSVFQVGMGLFAFASLLCGLSPTAGFLIFARCLQGLGAALAMPSSLSLLQASYPNREARARAYGIWGGVAGVAAGAGPVLGGALVTGLGWRSVFFVNVPIGAVGLVLAARYLRAPLPQPCSAAERFRSHAKLASYSCNNSVTLTILFFDDLKNHPYRPLFQLWRVPLLAGMF